MARLTVTHADRPWTFHEADPPKQPLRTAGEIKIVGWDIPHVYAIDADGAVFANLSAHGSVMGPVTAEQLLSAARCEEDENAEADIRRALGLKRAAPAWMRAAKAQGWAPPEGFDADSYDWA